MLMSLALFFCLVLFNCFIASSVQTIIEFSEMNSVYVFDMSIKRLSDLKIKILCRLRTDECEGKELDEA